MLAEERKELINKIYQEYKEHQCVAVELHDGTKAIVIDINLEGVEKHYIKIAITEIIISLYPDGCYERSIYDNNFDIVGLWKEPKRFKKTMYVYDDVDFYLSKVLSDNAAGKIEVDAEIQPLTEEERASALKTH